MNGHQEDKNDKKKKKNFAQHFETKGIERALVNHVKKMNRTLRLRFFCLYSWPRDMRCEICSTAGNTFF
jgi:hypothetical protein